jgi:type I restriction enzyme S subunit
MAKAKKKKLSLEELLEEAIVKEEDRPYEVPENWVWTKINSISDFERGITFPASAKKYENDTNLIACIRTANIQENLETQDLIYVDRSFMKNNQNKLLRKDDILMSSANSRELVGKVSYVDELADEMTFGGFVLNIRSKGIVSKFLFYFLRLEFLSGRFIGESTQTTNIANINRTILGNYICPIPPIGEQQRIVEVIESLFKKLDAAKELVQNALDSFKNRKAAILHKAFTGEFTAKWREENGISFESWKETNLKSVCKISSGGTPSRKNKEYYNGKIPWIKTGEIIWNYINDSEEKITGCAIDNSSAKLFPKGTVLVAMYGQGLTRGRAAILNIEAATNQAVCALMPNSELVNKYLYYYFMCNYWMFREKAVGGNQPNFSGKIIGEFVINIPSFEEQQEIVRILDNLLGNEQRAKELCDVIEKIDLMKKAILAKAFRGELGTNNPEEESAVELLKEVLKEKL